MPSRFWLFYPSASHAGARGSAWFTQIPRKKCWTVIGKLSLRPSARNRFYAPTALTQSCVRKQKNRSSWQRVPSQHVQESDQGRRLQWIEGHAEITAKHMKRVSVHDVDVDDMDRSLDLTIFIKGNDSSALSEINMKQECATEGQRWGNFGRTIDTDIYTNVPKRRDTMTQVMRFVQDEEGATALEYGLLAALIAAVIIGAVTTLGNVVSTTFNTIAASMKDAASS